MPGSCVGLVAAHLGFVRGVAVRGHDVYVVDMGGWVPGKGRLLLDLEEPGEFCAVLEPHNCLVAADRLFIDQVEELVGRGGVRIMD